jgi:hypothetical protein
LLYVLGLAVGLIYLNLAGHESDYATDIGRQIAADDLKRLNQTMKKLDRLIRAPGRSPRDLAV